MRMPWDEYFIRMAKLAAQRSTCLRRQVGAIIVSTDNHVLSTGYNGPPRGVEHCNDTGCLRDEMGIPSGDRLDICRAVHAEQNAIIQAAVHGVSVSGAILYCTNQPCFTCAKMIVNARIHRVVFMNSYSDNLAMNLLIDADIKVDVFGVKQWALRPSF